MVSFTNSNFPNLATLQILRNSFSQIILENFFNLQTLSINSTAPSNGNSTETEPSNGNITLIIRQAPKLTSFTVVLPTCTNASISDTLLTSFPDASSNLTGLQYVSLTNNSNMTTLYTSKMPNVLEYNITGTPIENTDDNGTLKKLKLSRTSLKAFTGWVQNQLESLII